MQYQELLKSKEELDKEQTENKAKLTGLAIDEIEHQAWLQNSVTKKLLTELEKGKKEIINAMIFGNPASGELEIRMNQASAQTITQVINLIKYASRNVSNS